MTTEAGLAPIHLDFEVDCSQRHAFAIWAERTSLWWPSSHTVTAEPGLEVVFEPHPGGRIFERTRAGDEHDWGRIEAWDPPRRLAYTWHLNQDRADATDVEITFTPLDGGRTRVDIDHRGWERLGAAGPGLRARNTAGWAGVLPHYVVATADPEVLATIR
jgi:uncharacterized protein YndB with AHSA1/START domain